ncbi:signal transduction histidine kinase [Rhodococcus sp. 27YEA15]|uniref:sensor histidine kinase n=1 Tax=Rhodococcus sp. 27YEA15 TaxID=3156259 RepID=UPI003C79BDAD
MPAVHDLLLIVGTTVTCTAVITAVAWIVLRINRHGSIASQFVVVVAAAVLSIACSTIMVLIEMFFSAHDLVVLGWVMAVSTLMSVGAAWLITTRVAKRSISSLIRSTRQIADGDVLDPQNPGWREFNELSEQLSETSQRLADARSEIDKLDAARRQFFAWISHDLRTPLAGIRAMAEALGEGVVADPDLYVRLIRDKVDTVNHMVDDLFELSRIESGSFGLRCEIVDLLDLVSDAVSDVQEVALQRDIRIRQNGMTGHTLWGDARELTRAIGNLLANGIRYTPDGSEILISATTRDDGHLVLSILDHGSGVSTEDLGRMFDVGWRGDAARQADSSSGVASGAGLGLAIVRGIVHAHGGDVYARSVEGGFCLDVTLPLQGLDQRRQGISM